MPSASAKVDKIVDYTMDPFKNSIKFVEHKIRNLEKRKAKLDVYKKDQQDGKELNADQLAAVAKFTEVMQQLDFSRDFLKQLTQLNDENDKTLKKQQRQQKAEQMLEQQKNYENLLVFQGILKKMGEGKGREILLDEKFSFPFSEDDLKALTEFKNLVDPGNPTNADYTTIAASAGEKFSQLFEGSSKVAVNGKTFRELRTMLIAIRKSNYLSALLTIETENSLKEPSPDKIVTEVSKPPPAQNAKQKRDLTKNNPANYKELKETYQGDRIEAMLVRARRGTKKQSSPPQPEQQEVIIQDKANNKKDTGYNFLQDSRIDISMDPAVVAVSSVAPMMPQRIPNYNNSFKHPHPSNTRVPKRSNVNHTAKTKKKVDKIEEWKPEPSQEWVPPPNTQEIKQEKWKMDPIATADEWTFQNDAKIVNTKEEWAISGEITTKPAHEIEEWVCPIEEPAPKPAIEMEDWVAPKEPEPKPTTDDYDPEEWTMPNPAVQENHADVFQTTNTPKEETPAEDDWSAQQTGDEWGVGFNKTRPEEEGDANKWNQSATSSGGANTNSIGSFQKRRSKTATRPRGGRGSHNGYGRDQPRDQNRDYSRDYGRGDFNRDYNRDQTRGGGDHNSHAPRVGFANGRGGHFHGQGDQAYDTREPHENSADFKRGGSYRGNFRGAHMNNDLSYSRGSEFRRGRGGAYRGGMPMTMTY